MKNLLLFTTLIFSISSPLATATDILTTNKTLSGNQTLVSSSNSFVLGFFSPTNSTNRYIGIWYGNITAFTIVWIANRHSPITSLSTFSLNLTSTGSLLLISNQSSTPLWSSPAAPTNSRTFVAQLLESGNFVVKQKSRAKFIWQSFDYPADTLLPGMKLGSDLKSGLTRNLISWANTSDPSPGKYTMDMDLRGVPQLVIKSGSVWVWRVGPWNGAGFVGAATEVNYHTATYISNYTANQDEVFYSFAVIHGVLIRVVIGFDGKARLFVWFDPPGEWRNFYTGPSDACDRISVCGSNGVCDLSSGFASTCSCLPGFGFDSKAGVCLRRDELRCGGGDGFGVVNRVKLPDTWAAVMEGDMDLDGCRERCLRNCSCTAYAGANVTEGGRGCVMWASELNDIKVMVNEGQDLYIRLALHTVGKL